MVDVAGPDPDRLLEREDEDLAVSDLTGAGALTEGADGGLDEVVGDRDLKPDLLRQAHLHSGAAVGLDPVELAAVPLHATDRKTTHLCPVERLQNLVRPLGSDYADHEFHAASLSASLPNPQLLNCPAGGSL
jgi:hypothetical protein